MNLIDISRGFFSTAVYPGDPAPTVTQLASFDRGDGYNLSAITACVHTATHADAPLHFFADGASVDELALRAFIGPCRVLETPPGVITGDAVDRRFPADCSRLLIKGGGRAFFMESAAQELAARGLLLIGTDSLSVGCPNNEAAPHKAFLQNGVAILEGLDLSAVAPGDYFLFAPPIKLEGLEGAPVRAVLADDPLLHDRRPARNNQLR